MAGWLALVAQGPPWAGSWLSRETRVGGWGDSAPTTREGEVVRVIVVTVSWGGWAHKEGRALCVCVCVVGEGPAHQRAGKRLLVTQAVAGGGGLPVNLYTACRVGLGCVCS